MSAIEPVISASGLTKTFGVTRALDGLELTVRPGEVHGFLGPNGAGKTTTIRVLLGLLRRDCGDVTVDGRRTRFSVDQSELDVMLQRLAALGVQSLVTSPPTLEELFLRHYGGSDLVAVP